MHHGIEGQKWGVKNGPPYPLKPKSYKSIKATIRKSKRESDPFKRAELIDDNEYLRNATKQLLYSKPVSDRLKENMGIHSKNVSLKKDPKYKGREEDLFEDISKNYEEYLDKYELFTSGNYLTEVNNLISKHANELVGTKNQKLNKEVITILNRNLSREIIESEAIIADLWDSLNDD